jgi:hypothetical protein
LLILALLALALPAAAPAQTAPAKRWKNYVKGPGVTAVTKVAETPLGDYTLDLDCPGNIQTDQPSVNVTARFTYHPPVGAPAATSVSYTCTWTQTPQGGSPIVISSNSAADTTLTEPPEVWLEEAQLAAPAVANVTDTYTFTLEMLIEPGDISLSDSCSFTVTRVAEPPPQDYAFTILQVQKNGLDNIFREYAESATVPVCVSEPSDVFRFYLRPEWGTPGIYKQDNAVTYELFGPSSGTVPLFVGTFDFAADGDLGDYYDLPAWASLPISLVDAQTGRPQSLAPGQYELRLTYLRLNDPSHGSYRYSGAWDFHVDPPELAWLDEYSDESYCLQDPVTVELLFNRDNISDWRQMPGEPNALGHLFWSSTSLFTEEFDLGGEAEFGTERISFVPVSDTAGTYYYRLKARAEYPGGATAAVTSANVARVRYYPDPGWLSVSASPCAVTGVPYRVTATCMVWNSLNPVFLDESTDPAFATFTAIPVYSQGQSVWRTKTVFQDTPFYYRTRVDNRCSDSIVYDQVSPVLTITVHSVDTTAPSVNLLSATALDHQSIQLALNGADCGRLAEFRIHRDVAAGFTPSEENRVAVIAPTPGADSVYIDDGLEYGTTYYYRAVAVDTAGNVSNPSGERFATTYPDATPPVFPAGAAVVLSYYKTDTDEFAVLANRQVLLVNFPAADEPDTRVSMYQLDLLDETDGGDPVHTWNEGDAGRKVLVLPEAAALEEGHNYRLRAVAMNTSWGVSTPITSASFQYLPGHTYDPNQNHFTVPDQWTNGYLEAEYDPAGQTIRHDASLSSMVIEPAAGTAALRRKLRPAPRFTFEAVIKTLSAYDDSAWFEIRLEGPQGYYVIRAGYGYGGSETWAAKYVNGMPVASRAIGVNVAQSQSYLFFLEHELLPNGAGGELSRLYISAFGQDYILDDPAGHAIDVYQVRIVSCQQNLGWDYFYHCGGSVAAVPLDETPPSQPVVDDGGSILDWNATTGVATVNASWVSTEPQSDIVEYQYAVGTYPGGFTVKPWTSVPDAGAAITFTAADKTTYYVSVKARNSKNLWSAVGSSDGLLADKFSCNETDFFDPYDTDFNLDPYYDATPQVVLYQPTAGNVAVTYSNVYSPSFFARWWAYGTGGASQYGSFRVMLNLHDAPINPANHDFDIFLGFNIGENGDPGDTHYKIKLTGIYLTVEYWVSNVRKYTQTKTASFNRHQWNYLQFTFKPTGYKIEGLGVTQSWTKSSTNPISVDSFLFRFRNVNLELDNVGLSKNTFGF